MMTDSESMNFNDENLICALGAAQLEERKEKLRTEIFSKVKETEEIDQGYAFTFGHDGQYVKKLVEFILAENSCCPSLQFDVSLKGKNDGVLIITGTSQPAKEMIKSVFIDSPE